MKFYLVLPIYLVLAVAVFQIQAEDVIFEGGIPEGAPAEGTIAKGAIVEGAIAEGPIVEDAKAEGPIVEETKAEGAIGEEAKDKTAVVEVAVVDGAAADGATAKNAAIVEEGDIVTIDCVYQKPDCFCPQYEEPVCSVNGCTYGNDCKRICADAEYAYEGACHEDDLDVVE